MPRGPVALPTMRPAQSHSERRHRRLPRFEWTASEWPQLAQKALVELLREGARGSTCVMRGPYASRRLHASAGCSTRPASIELGRSTRLWRRAHRAARAPDAPDTPETAHPPVVLSLRVLVLG